MPAKVLKRHLCSELVSLTCADSSEWWYAVRGNLEEIEEWSAVILADIPISPGTKVRIRCETNQLKGTVESFLRDSLGFLIKIRFDPDSRWSERWFTPQHLLTLTSRLRAQVFPRGAVSGY